MKSEYILDIKNKLDKFNPDINVIDYSIEDECEFICFEKMNIKLFINYFDEDIGKDIVCANIFYGEKYLCLEENSACILDIIESIIKEMDCD